MTHIPPEERLAQIVELVQSEMALLPSDQVRRILVGRLVRLVCPEGRIQDGPQTATPEALPPMSAQEAEHFGHKPIGFGVHAKKRYRDAPRQYLEWLADAKRAEWQTMHRYLQAPARIRQDEQAEHDQTPPDHDD